LFELKTHTHTSVFSLETPHTRYSWWQHLPGHAHTRTHIYSHHPSRVLPLYWRGKAETHSACSPHEAKAPADLTNVGPGLDQVYQHLLVCTNSKHAASSERQNTERFKKSLISSHEDLGHLERRAQLLFWEHIQQNVYCAERTICVTVTDDTTRAERYSYKYPRKIITLVPQ